MAGPHHRGTHPRRARAIVAAANANPTTRCMSEHCQHGNGTLAQHPPGSKWQGGHPPGMEGVIGAPLQPEVDCCNARGGQAISSKRRAKLQTTRPW